MTSLVAVLASRSRWRLWAAAGGALISLAVGFFGFIAYRDDATLKHGERASGSVVGFVQPHGWDPFDNGRLVVSYSRGGELRTDRIWVDDGLDTYALGDRVPVFVRGSHVRTDKEPNDPAPWGSAAVVTGLLGVGFVVRGLVVRWPRSEESEGRFGLIWWLGVPVFCTLLLPLIASDLGPAYDAHRGRGTPGVFVATSEDCGGKGGCSYTGDFRSDDGTVVRKDVGIASGSQVHDVGDASKAVDTGSDGYVYPAGGGHDWLYVTGFLIVAAGLALVWVASVADAVVTRRGSAFSVAGWRRSGSRPRRRAGGSRPR